ncbi:MAG: hypothetical protein ACOCVF_00095 [bacterium]
MKLKNLLKVIFEENPDVNIITGEDLGKYKDSILKCNELKDVKNFNIILSPINNTKDNTKTASTYKVCDNMYFGENFYLYSIEKSPKIYDPVKDGACITPILYRPIDFSPYKKICIEFLPENSFATNHDISRTDKMELYELFEKILNSPEEYLSKGEYEYMIRGFFDTK